VEVDRSLDILNRHTGVRHALEYALLLLISRVLRCPNAALYPTGGNRDSAEQLTEASHEPLLDLGEQDFDTQLSL
jgi:hypothetical protein